MTFGAMAAGAGSGKASMALAVRSGSSITGPGANFTSIPSASIGLMMSAKTIAASSGKRSIGIKVTSVARSGRAQSSSKENFSRNARYSGR